MFRLGYFGCYFGTQLGTLPVYRYLHIYFRPVNNFCSKLFPEIHQKSIMLYNIRWVAFDDLPIQESAALLILFYTSVQKEMKIKNDIFIDQ